jgi:hypothetical protein
VTWQSTVIARSLKGDAAIQPSSLRGVHRTTKQSIFSLRLTIFRLPRHYVPRNDCAGLPRRSFATRRNDENLGFWTPHNDYYERFLQLPYAKLRLYIMFLPCNFVTMLLYSLNNRFRIYRNLTL